MNFKVHTRQTAPDASRPTLEATEKAYGFLPNLHGVLAESPTALRAYSDVTAALSDAALDPVEQQLVMLAVSVENGCTYCVGAHSMVAGMVNMPEAVLAALREQRPLPDPRLEALHRFTRAVVQQRGWIPESELKAFEEAGYAQREVLDVLAIVALKTLSNYTNHIAGTPLDAAFSDHAWTRKSA